MIQYVRRGLVNYEVLHGFFFLASISRRRKMNPGLVKWTNKQGHPGSGTESVEGKLPAAYHSFQAHLEGRN